jgi:translation initiation factor 5B
MAAIKKNKSKKQKKKDPADGEAADAQTTPTTAQAPGADDPAASAEPDFNVEREPDAAEVEEDAPSRGPKQQQHQQKGLPQRTKPQDARGGRDAKGEAEEDGESHLKSKKEKEKEKKEREKQRKKEQVWKPLLQPRFVYMHTFSFLFFIYL